MSDEKLAADTAMGPVALRVGNLDAMTAYYRDAVALQVLETGDEQPDAIRFYEREGFTRIPNFGYYVDSPYSVCFEKTL